MEILRYPERNEWSRLCKRAIAETAVEVKNIVADIIANIRERGDEALTEYEERFTGAQLSSLSVTQQEIDEAESLVSEDLKKAISLAAQNISTFHAAQTMNPIPIETAPGVKCVQKAVAISKVGLYIPGGNSPLFSTVLMLAIPARIAG